MRQLARLPEPRPERLTGLVRPVVPFVPVGLEQVLGLARVLPPSVHDVRPHRQAAVDQVLDGIGDLELVPEAGADAIDRLEDLRAVEPAPVAEEEEREERAEQRCRQLNLPLMVSVGRLDYSFEFSSIIRSMAGDARMQRPLRSVPLQESLALVESGIYCTRSAWGLRIAGRLDQAIRELAREPEPLLDLYRRYMPAATHDLYADKLADYYRQRADLPPLLPAEPAEPSD